MDNVGIYKAVKLEVMILVESPMSDDEIIKWTEDAMRDYCDFEASTVKIIEKHENVTVDPQCEAIA